MTTTSDRRVVRDSSWIDREYNREKWATQLGDILEIADGGETSLARTLGIVERRRQMRLSWYRQPTDALEILTCGAPAALPFAAAFAGVTGLVAATVAEAATGETSAIVELGSGIGQNLCHTWLAGAPRDIPYFAAEYTESGRKCSAALSALEPGLDLRPVAFDFHMPDYGFLADLTGHVVVFTCQSIEQIPQLSPAALVSLLDLDCDLSMLHFEPCGWQIADDPVNDATGKAYAEANDYNRNLWMLLKALQDRGLVRIGLVRKNLFGTVAANSISLISWRKTRPSQLGRAINQL